MTTVEEFLVWKLDDTYARNDVVARMQQFVKQTELTCKDARRLFSVLNEVCAKSHRKSIQGFRPALEEIVRKCLEAAKMDSVPGIYPRLRRALGEVEQQEPTPKGPLQNECLQSGNVVEWRNNIYIVSHNDVQAHRLDLIPINADAVWIHLTLDWPPESPGYGKAKLLARTVQEWLCDRFMGMLKG